jgi:lipopolysaccharide transport system permease protein
MDASPLQGGQITQQLGSFSSRPGLIGSLLSAIVAVPGSLLGNLSLVLQLSARELRARYRGSMLGAAWLVLVPLLMLAVYTFVFTVVFPSRWSGGGGGRAEFAILMYSGLVVFGFFGDVIGRAPRLIVDHANYVKKVVFPLEALVWVAIGPALFTLGVNLLILAAFISATGTLPLTAALLPLYLAPLVLLVAGLAWLLASIGVFIRDLGQVIGVLVSALLFVTPIFYPVSAVPPSMQAYLHINPLTFYVEACRALAVAGTLPPFGATAAAVGLACGVAWLGSGWFRYSRHAFADVL